jgi:LPPG:FO 2-phospho-L-lactate transferase
MKVAVLAGGYGGSRFAHALAETIAPHDLTVIGNVGDDLEVLGLHVSPDLDSIMYTLAGLFDEKRGWGRSDETWNALEEVGRLGGEDWFRLGDRDLGLHLVRTAALRGGERLSAVTARIATALGVEPTVLPATDERLRTRVRTPSGELSFQEWFVARRHEDPVLKVTYDGAESAAPAPGVVEALEGADLIAIAPSNPYMSIHPILAVPAIRTAIEQRSVPCVAVSPLIGGTAVKGPADTMLERLAGGTGAAQVTQCYLGLIDVLVIDEADADDADEVAVLGVRPVVTRTLMRDAESRRKLAEAVLEAVALVQ